MFTLRVILDDNSEFNTILGSNYSVVRREKTPEQYNILFERVFLTKPEEDEKCYGFVISGNAKETIPLFINRCNYIMNENGKTFSNITF